jgi:hypothetical protein
VATNHSVLYVTMSMNPQAITYISEFGPVPTWTITRRSTESLLMERLPQFDFVAVGIVYPREAAVAFVLALRVDADAFFR